MRKFRIEVVTFSLKSQLAVIKSVLRRLYFLQLSLFILFLLKITHNLTERKLLQSRSLPGLVNQCTDFMLKHHRPKIHTVRLTTV